jgi:hypothetical protein
MMAICRIRSESRHAGGMVDMSPHLTLLQPSDCILVLIDQQAGIAFGVGSENRQILLNNTVALGRAATFSEYQSSLRRPQPRFTAAQ